MNADQELDARGLSCPLPILKTKKSLSTMAAGQVLKVIATDPGSVKDMKPSPPKPGMNCCPAPWKKGNTSSS